MSERRVRAVVGALVLATLAGGLALPLIGLALVEERAPYCGPGGRCCCRGGETQEGDRPCLRGGCRCGSDDPVATGAPFAREAVLAKPGGLIGRAGASFRWPVASGCPLNLATVPPTPPPRLLPA